MFRKAQSLENLKKCKSRIDDNRTVLRVSIANARGEAERRKILKMQDQNTEN
jgi:hypothetical protein